MARLVGGRADPDGAWAYGHLEVFDGLVFRNIPSDRITQANTMVACRSLGFRLGAALPAGQLSSVRLDANESLSFDAAFGQIDCNGDEESLAECELSPPRQFGLMSDADGPDAFLFCATPSGTCPGKFPYACA